MKTKKLLLLFFIISPLFSPAQINALDSAGKRNGVWIVYLDKKWKHIDDSVGAVYCRYTVYIHGDNIYPMGPRSDKWKMVGPDSTIKKGNLILLNGDYKWYDEKGVLRSEDVFKDGDYVLYKWYYSSGQLNQVFDYTKHYNNEAYSWYVIEYDKKGNVKNQIYIRRGPDGWPWGRD